MDSTIKKQSIKQKSKTGFNAFALNRYKFKSPLSLK
jgi:hypothetical protein